MIKDNRLPLKQKFLDYFADAPIQKYAGAFIGVSEDTVKRWKDEDRDFADQIEAAKAAYVRRNLKMVRSKEWILERLFKDHFASRQEFTGKNGESLIPTPILGGRTTTDALPSNNGDK